jgi:hypothetical protein
VSGQAPGAYGGYGAAYYPAYAQPRNNGLAIGAMVTSLVGIPLTLCYGIGALLGVAGAIMGHVARRQIRDRGENGAGMALTGIIVGWVIAGLGVAFLVLIILAITLGTPTSDFGGDIDDAIRLALRGG